MAKQEVTISASRSFQTQYSGQPGRPTAQTQSSLSIAPRHYVEFQLFAGFLTRQKTTTLSESRHFIPVTFILPRLLLRRKRLKQSFFKRSFSGRLLRLNQRRRTSRKTGFKPVRKVVGNCHVLQEYAQKRGAREKSLGQN